MQTFYRIGGGFACFDRSNFSNIRSTTDFDACDSICDERRTEFGKEGWRWTTFFRNGSLAVDRQGSVRGRVIDLSHWPKDQLPGGGAVTRHVAVEKSVSLKDGENYLLQALKHEGNKPGEKAEYQFRLYSISEFGHQGGYQQAAIRGVNLSRYLYTYNTTDNLLDASKKADLMIEALGQALGRPVFVDSCSGPFGSYDFNPDSPLAKMQESWACNERQKCNCCSSMSPEDKAELKKTGTCP